MVADESGFGCGDTESAAKAVGELAEDSKELVRRLRTCGDSTIAVPVATLTHPDLTEVLAHPGIPARAAATQGLTVTILVATVFLATPGQNLRLLAVDAGRAVEVPRIDSNAVGVR